MNDKTDSFKDVESLLGRYQPNAAPPPPLRARVVSTARSHARHNRFESIAACLILGITLGTIALSTSEGQPAVPHSSAPQLAAKIQLIEPSLPPQQAQQLAMRLSAAERLTPMPEIHGHLFNPGQMGEMR